MPMTDTSASPRPGDYHDCFRFALDPERKSVTVKIPVARIGEWREIEAVNDAIRKAGR